MSAVDYTAVIRDLEDVQAKLPAAIAVLRFLAGRGPDPFPVPAPVPPPALKRAAPTPQAAPPPAPVEPKLEAQPEVMDIEKPLGAQQVRWLRALDNGPKTPVDLAKAMGSEMGNCYATTSVLKGKGVIESIVDDEDGGQRKWRLTEKGKAAIA